MGWLFLPDTLSKLRLMALPLCYLVHEPKLFHPHMIYLGMDKRGNIDRSYAATRSMSQYPC